MSLFFFFNDTPPTEISPLPLHDALPIWAVCPGRYDFGPVWCPPVRREYEARNQIRGIVMTAISERSGAARRGHGSTSRRSEEHTSELQSQSNLVCRLLLEKKKK